MELMDRCLDQLYKLVYEKLKLRIPEAVVGKMAEAVRHYLYTRYVRVDLLSPDVLLISFQTVKALHFLKANLNVLHRGIHTTLSGISIYSLCTAEDSIL